MRFKISGWRLFVARDREVRARVVAAARDLVDVFRVVCFAGMNSLRCFRIDFAHLLGQ
jgi:hypothetical protein